MTDRSLIGNLQVATELAEFVNVEVLPRIGLEPDNFWSAIEILLHEFTPRNRKLLQARDNFQASIDEWHRNRRDLPFDIDAYTGFLSEIGYLLPECPDFTIATDRVDSEIARQAGPQLVVPVKNARFALNAANARWGSLYDALYGTDAISDADGAERSGDYNPLRGQKVINYARELLDLACPLRQGSHKQVTAYRVKEAALLVETADTGSGLAQPGLFVGYRGRPEAPEAVLLCHNDLHIEIQIDRESAIGKTDKAGIKDLLMEAAITTIQDCEDSVAAVDAEDKLAVYRNWLGLVNGDLSERFIKNGKEVSRVLQQDREYTNPKGDKFSLPGRSLMLVRNVGHLMRNEAVLDASGEEIYEGILDAVITSAIGAIDVKQKSRLRNSRAGSIYIVKPKMHGPAEVEFTNDLFEAVEKLLGLELNTIKVGIMDEERRTSINLKNCIRAARERVVFINTGFLDRTGDEIHTSMEAGPLIPKAEMKNTVWMKAYEDNNVDVGLACGFLGRAQIGKGMWAMPDLMARMLEEKIWHPRSGANTAWVPSPTAAVLHAIHYHQVNVKERQSNFRSRQGAKLSDILTIPILEDPSRLSAEQIQLELDNNAQGILGYVVRWVDQGIGCSKVPDIHNIGLMEDRATLRISSQLLANWLHHGVCSERQVRESLQRMAAIVDIQNAGDPSYRAMAPKFDESIAFQTACDLVFKGVKQANGYTEPGLHYRRLQYKQRASQ